MADRKRPVKPAVFSALCRKHRISTQAASRYAGAEFPYTLLAGVAIVCETRFDQFAKRFHSGKLRKAPCEFKDRQRVDMARLREMHSEGKANCEIAEALGVSLGAVTRAMQRAGLRRNPYPTKTLLSMSRGKRGRQLWEVANPDRIPEFRALWEAGRPIPLVAQVCGMSYHTACKVAERLGIEVQNTNSKGEREG